MSWQGYVDDQLIGTGSVEKGAIIGAADGGNWAVKPADFLKAGEGAKIVALFKNPADVFAQGITVGGVKYMGIKGDGRSVYGKKGATGICAVKTGQSILVAYYNEKQTPGNAAVVVEKLADYLIENGY